MSDQPTDRAELVAELRRLRGELARAFDRIPYLYPAGDAVGLRSMAERVEVNLDELISVLDSLTG